MLALAYAHLGALRSSWDCQGAVPNFKQSQYILPCLQGNTPQMCLAVSDANKTQHWCFAVLQACKALWQATCLLTASTPYKTRMLLLICWIVKVGALPVDMTPWLFTGEHRTMALWELQMLSFFSLSLNTCNHKWFLYCLFSFLTAVQPVSAYSRSVLSFRGNTF